MVFNTNSLMVYTLHQREKSKRNGYHQNPLKLIALLSRGSSINDTCNNGGATMNNVNASYKSPFEIIKFIADVEANATTISFWY